MKRIFIIVILTFICNFLNAQTPLAPAYELTADTAGAYTIPEKYLQFFQETDETFSLNQVLKKPFKSAKELGPSDERVERGWFRYRIKNPFNHAILIYFDTNSDWDEQHYLSPDGKWQHNLTGMDVPWSKKTGFNRFNGYYLTIDANEEYIFYQRSTVKGFNKIVMSPSLDFAIKGNISDALVKNYEFEIGNTQTKGFLLGFTLLAAVFSFLFFCFSREKVYLYFSLTNTIFIFFTAATLIKSLFFRETPTSFDTVTSYIFPFFYYFLWLFLSNFFKTKQYYPNWTRITNIVGYWPFLVWIVITFSNPYFINKGVTQIFDTTYGTVQILFLLNILVIVFASTFKNKAEFYFNTLLIAPLSISALLVPISFVLNNVYGREDVLINFVIDHLLMALLFSYYWMIVMFLLKLVFRHQQLQKDLLSEAFEKEKLAKENEMEKGKLIAAQKIELEHQVAERTLELNRSLQRSDALLLNILPEDVAEELKEKGTADAHLFDEVTVLFTDFVNFTTISEQLSPQELVDELHHCFKAFDEICTKYNIEKIKTIGDAYLAVTGLPTADPQHALHTIKAAKEITAFIQNRRKESSGRTFDIRVGINSGSVVAGIVGVKKFAYDIWGDTVNIAARMEQNSEPGKINVSEKTYELVKNNFEFIYRGEIEAKNKGALKMYFVENGIL